MTQETKITGIEINGCSVRHGGTYLHVKKSDASRFVSSSPVLGKNDSPHEFTSPEPENYVQVFIPSVSVEKINRTRGDTLCVSAIGDEKKLPSATKTSGVFSASVSIVEEKLDE